MLCIQGVYHGWQSWLLRTQKDTKPQTLQTYKSAVLLLQGQKHVTRPAKNRCCGIKRVKMQITNWEMIFAISKYPPRGFYPHM